MMSFHWIRLKFLSFSGAEYAANAYDRLINYNVDHVSEIYPGIAERWDISDGRFDLHI